MVVACPIPWNLIENRTAVAWFKVPVVVTWEREPARLARPTMESLPVETSDEALLGLIASGDASSFASFYDRHSTLLFSVAIQVLHDDREAEDVLQEAMILLWERAGMYDSSLGKPLSWAVTLTRNRAIDRLRSLKRRLQIMATAVEEYETEMPDTATAATELMMDESAQNIRAALTALPSEQRQAIEQAFFRGLTHAEIAKQGRVPLGTVKARIRRGMLGLRDALEGSL